VSRVLGPSDYRRVAWKNGLGSTLELAVDALDWTWRLSIADVPAAAPFSAFPGVDRFLACLEGPGLKISRAGKSVLVPSEGEALAFAGEEAVSGEPLGPGVRDVNLMLRRDRWRGRMHLTRGKPFTIAGDILLVHAPASSEGARVEADSTVAVLPGSTLIGNGRVSLDGTAVVCALEPR